MSSVVSVSQLNTFIKSMFDSEERLKTILISGEISNFTNHYKSGHLYFSLKDAKSTVRAVMFSDSAKRLRFLPKDGMKVIVSARVTVYEATGQYQLYVQSMQPDGLGAMNLAYEQIKEKLDKEGLFKSNRQLPLFPRRIGVITSATGAAFHDIINILSRRWPVCEVVFAPSAVQGELAERQLILALDSVYKEDIDVIIIGRGGGSAEDLWSFNSEALARKIFQSPVPVVSAVGHEVDYTICDFVSDHRAPTPSGAAEIVSPDIYELMAYFEDEYAEIKDIMADRVNNYRLLIDDFTNNSVLAQPTKMLSLKEEQIKTLREKLCSVMSINIKKQQINLVQNAGRLQELSPLKTLSRGFSYISDLDDKNISSVNHVKVGDSLKAKLNDGDITVTVTGKGK